MEEFCKRIPACPPDQNEPHAITTVEVFHCYHYEKVPSLLSWPCIISLEIHNTTETQINCPNLEQVARVMTSQVLIFSKAAITKHTHRSQDPYLYPFKS